MACQYQPRNDNDELHTEARSTALQRRRARVTSIEQENDKYTGPIETEDGEKEEVAKMRIDPGSQNVGA